MSSRSFPDVVRARLGALGLLVALTLAVGCNDDKSEKADPVGEQDAGADAAVPKSSLRPTLERPPTNGLPADLRPPR